MTTTGDATLDRMLGVHPLRSADKVTRVWEKLPESVKVQFAEHVHRPDEELFFAFKYARYYFAMHKELIEQQLFFTQKYAFFIAPLVSAMPLDSELLPYKTKWVGELVDYSFVSFRIQFQPDIDDYDPDLIRGAVIRKLLPFELVDLDPVIASGVGASWEIVAKHWEKLKDGTTADAYLFVEHLRQGGSVHLTDGLL